MTFSSVWRITLDGVLTSAPTLWGDRVVCPVQPSVQAETSTCLAALNLADGRRVWQHTFPHALVSGLVVRGDRLLVGLTSADLLRGAGALVALDAHGEVVWRWTPGARQVSAPAVHGETAFVTVDAESVVAVDVHTGREQRPGGMCFPKGVPPLSASRSAPAITDDSVLIPCCAPHLLAFSLDGALRWRFDVAGALWLDQTPAALGDAVYAVSSVGRIFALAKADGALLWQTDAGPAGKPLTAPVTDGERLYVGARDGVYALALDGRVVWHFPTARSVDRNAAPVVVGGVVYVTCHDHHLYALAASTGKHLWRSPMERRSEISPLIVSTDSTEALAIVADAGGTVTALARPLSAVEHAAAGQWSQAAAWWAAQGEPLRQAEALQQHARAQEEAGTATEPLADLWAGIAGLYAAAGEGALAANCRREVARCLRQPELTLEIEHAGLTLNAWTMIDFIVRNVGFGPARNVIIHASGERFAGQATRTQRLLRLDAGARAIEPLDIKPLEHGPSVPLHVKMEFVDTENRPYTYAQTLHLPVARTALQARRTLHSRIISAPAFVDMEVRIFRREAGGYPVEITLGDGQNFKRGYLDAALAGWSTSGDCDADGRQLSAALLADANLRDAWARARGQAPRRRIRLRISASAPELHALPWELLQEDALWLSANAATPFSRYLPVAEPWGARVEERPLCVLALIANPADLSDYGLAPLDAAQEKAALQAAFAGAPEKTLRLDFLEAPVTPARLADALRQRPHILHIVGHGTFDRQRGQGALYLEDADGLTAPVDHIALGTLLARQDARPRLVLLAACQSAACSPVEAFRGMAPRLIEAGVPAVVAMQSSVSFVSARDLSATFYRRLVEHGAVDLALNEARSALIAAHRPDAATPVLYMRLKDGQLFRSRS